MMPHPNPPELGAVLRPVKAWPGQAGNCGEDGAAANLDRPCARLPWSSAGRDEGKAEVEPGKASEVR
jgi:hypothetical protein